MCKKKGEGKRCSLHYPQSHRRLSVRARQIFGTSNSANREKVLELEKSGLLATNRSTRARVAASLTDPELIRIAMRDKALGVQMALASNPVVRSDRELRGELLSGRPLRGGGIGPQDSRVLATLAGERLSARELRRLGETPENREARLAKETPLQRASRLAREARWERLASITPLTPDEAEDEDLDDVFSLSDAEMDAILGEEENEDFGQDLIGEPGYFHRSEAERIFDRLKEDPSFAETLSAEELSVAWAALPESQQAAAAVQMRTNPVVIRRMLMDSGSSNFAVKTIANLPAATIAATISTLLDGAPSQEREAALEYVIEALKIKGFIDEGTVGHPADLASAWLSKHQASA